MNAEEELIKKQLLEYEEIVFVNEPFMAIVEGRGDQPVKCYPVVFDEDHSCGIGIIFENGRDNSWGLISPRNFIAAWRATEIIRHIAHIENGTLCAAYYAGRRSVCQNAQDWLIETVNIIGMETYNQIMAMPVPEEIIQAIIDRQKKKDLYKPDACFINDELVAGTVSWRPEFADLNVERPEDTDVRNEMLIKTTNRFLKLLNSYIEFTYINGHFCDVYKIKSALVSLVEKKMDQEYPEDIVMAFAGVVGSIACRAGTSITMPCYKKYPEDDYDSWFILKKNSSIIESAAWLKKTRASPSIFFWKKKDPLTEEEARKLLSSLFIKYFPLYQTESNV